MASAVLKILRVGLIQGGKIVEDRLLPKHGDVTIGTDPGNTFVLPSSRLPASFSIFEHKNGQYHLLFTEQMQGKVRLDTWEVDFATLRSQRVAQQRGSSYVLPLNENSKGKVLLGDITLLFQFVSPPPLPVKTELPPLDKGSLWQSVDHLFFLILIASLAIHFTAATYLALLPSVEESELALDQLPDRFAKVILPPKLPEPAPPKEERREAERKEKREQTAGKQPRGDPTARRAEIQQRVASKGLLKILGSRGSGGAFADVLGQSTGTGEIASALAGASGIGIATADALGQGGTRKGGRAGAMAGIGDVGTSGGGNVNLGSKGDARVSGRVKDSTPDVDSGSVDREALARYVRQRLKAMQGCYERELKRNPSLKGKVLIRFSILPSGRSGDIEFEQNTLGDDAVTECIRSVIRGWIFPFKPPDSVSVAYPFVFSPAS
jgi:outer membrane biosynthesis protein TonB